MTVQGADSGDKLRSASGPVLFLVPARGRSKRLPGKNLATVAGIPLVARAVRAGREAADRVPAIEVVHLLGHPAAMDNLVVVARAMGIPIVEDASEALGARYTAGPHTGRHVGTIGRIGCFSFNGNKLVTTGGGGMITTDDPQLARRARLLSTQARLSGRIYWHEEVGYNYRLTNIAAAVGLAQLEELPSLLGGRRRNAARYDHGLAEIRSLWPAARAPWADPSFWLYTARRQDSAPSRDELIDAFAAAGIESRPVWTPLHRMALFAEAPRLGSGAVADTIFDDALSLPSSSNLSDQEAGRVIRTLKAAASNPDRHRTVESASNLRADEELTSRRHSAGGSSNI